MDAGTAELPGPGHALAHSIHFRISILHKEALQMCAHVHDPFLEARIVCKIAFLARVFRQMIEFVGTVWITVHILPFHCPDHPHRTVLVIHHDFIPPGMPALQHRQKALTGKAFRNMTSDHFRKERKQVTGTDHVMDHTSGLRNALRVAHQERHLDRLVIHVHRESAVALPPDAMVSHAHAVV